ncbi:diguanylate cyclase [uncultured Amphritea sp.]|uniref:sensor domain-containing diguanylate cyclase n=1 Tax=uncultured Amphritea sp. TaxID=981605 RepID=UPI0025DAE851|nr:diguanylate cyclase [uncultured Amphritea sp.]
MYELKHSQAKQTDDVDYVLGKSLPSRPVIPLILVLFGVSLISITGLMLMTFMSLESLTQDNFKQRVNTAFNVEIKRQQELLQEYSYWDEAHLNTIIEQDKDWTNEHLGKYLLDSYGINLSWAFSAGTISTITYLDGELENIHPDTLQSRHIVNLAEAATIAPMPHIVSGYHEYSGVPYLVSIGLFLDETTEQPKGDGSFLMFAQRLDDEKIANISKTYNLPGLHLTSVKSDTDITPLSFFGPTGDPLVNLTWNKVSPNKEYFLQLLLPVVLIFVVMTGLTCWLLASEYKNRRLYSSRLAELASKDFLTDISNRREFYSLANRAITRSNRDQTPLTLLIMDLDHFKKINDSLGHSAGDEVLAEFARLVKDNLRECDVFARIGGEEFAALLIASDQAKALEVAKRICRVISEHSFHNVVEHTVNCTVSIGLSVWNGNETLDNLISRTDKELYSAKHNGRNQVSIG